MCALVPPVLLSSQQLLFLTCNPQASLSSTGFMPLYSSPLSPRAPDSQCVYLLSVPCNDEIFSILGKKNILHCYYSIMTTTTSFYHIIHIFVYLFKNPPSIPKNPTSEILWLEWQSPQTLAVPTAGKDVGNGKRLDFSRKQVSNLYKITSKRMTWQCHFQVFA